MASLQPGPPGARLGLAELGPELARGGRASRLGAARRGRRAARAARRRGQRAVDLARAVANQTAVAIKKIQVIERLTEKNLIKDFFEELAGRQGARRPRRARRAARLRPRPAARRARRAGRRRRSSGLSVALLRARCSTGETTRSGRCCACRQGGRRPSESVRRVHARAPRCRSRSASRASAGESPASPTASKRRAGAFRHGRARPRGVRRGLRGARRLQVPAADRARGRRARRDDRRGREARRLRRTRGSSLLATLEEFLHRRGNISATSEALFVHPNTLRQRLRRIGDLSGIDLRRDDWLMVEIAVKLVKLRVALGDTPAT